MVSNWNQHCIIVLDLDDCIKTALLYSAWIAQELFRLPIKGGHIVEVLRHFFGYMTSFNIGQFHRAEGDLKWQRYAATRKHKHSTINLLFAVRIIELFDAQYLIIIVDDTLKSFDDFWIVLRLLLRHFHPVVENGKTQNRQTLIFPDVRQIIRNYSRCIAI